MKIEINILNWYDFKENSNILLINNINKNIIDLLKEKKCDIYLDLNQKQIFDYIIVFDNYKYIDEYSKYLYDDGKLLFVGNNSTGINRFSYISKKQELSIEHSKNNLRHIFECLNKNNFKYTNLFYVFPNIEKTELIINEKFKLKKDQILNYSPDENEKDIRIFDEKKILNNMIDIDTNCLRYFANGYFIETSKQEFSNDIKYVSFNNQRKETYKMITIITDNIVKKVLFSNLAKEHLEKYKSNIDVLKEQNIEILDYYEENKIYSKYIDDINTLDVFFGENYNKIDVIVKILNELKEMLLKNAIKYDTEFESELISGLKECEYLEELHFLKNAFWDMVPKNCFYVDNSFLFFDQEWEKDYLPVEFIIYRSVINSYELVKKINVDELFDKLGILKYKKLFENIDNELRNEILVSKTDNEKNNNIKSLDCIINNEAQYEKYVNRIDNEILPDLRNELSKKQKYIEDLENENKKLKEENEKYLKRVKRIFFWKR